MAELLIQQYERYLPSAFDDSLSILQKVNLVVEHMNKTGLLVNEVVKQWNEVMEWVMNDGFKENLDALLDEMMETGVFDQIITEALLFVGFTVQPRMVGETDDTPRLMRAIDLAKNKSGGGTVRLEHGVTYLVSSQLDCSSTRSVNFICDGVATIKATMPMESVLYFHEFNNNPFIEGVDLDGAGLANFCYKRRASNKLRFVRCHFKNARTAVMSLGFNEATGVSCYETSFAGVKITGLENTYSSENRPNYGILLLKGASDNFIDDIVIRNTKLAGIRDESTNNYYGHVHVFGSPEEFAPDYGVDLVGGSAVLNQLYTDCMRKAGIKMRKSANVVTSCNFYWRYDIVDPTFDLANACAVEVDNGVNNYIISNNMVRGPIGYDVKHLGSKAGNVFNNIAVSVTNPMQDYFYNGKDVEFGRFAQFNSGTRIQGLADITNLEVRLASLLKGGATVQNGLTVEQVDSSSFMDLIFNVKDIAKYMNLSMRAGNVKKWDIQQTKDFQNLNFIAYDDSGVQTNVITFNRGTKQITVTGKMVFSTAGEGLQLKSPNGTNYKIVVNDSGQLTVTQV